MGPLLSIGCVLDVQAVVIDGDLPDGLTGELVGRLRELLAAAAPEAREPPALRIGTVGRSAAATGAAILPAPPQLQPEPADAVRAISDGRTRETAHDDGRA